MGSFESRVQELGLTLPLPGPSAGRFVRTKQVGDLLFTSGHTPTRDGAIAYTGSAGAARTLDEAREAARLCILNALGSVRAALGTLDRVAEVVSVRGFVSSADDFYQQPQVMNAASDLLIDIFGSAGQHTRSALGVNALPGNATVEVELTFKLS